MYKQFLESLYKKLIQNDFRLLNNFNDEAVNDGISDRLRYFSMARKTGPVLYIAPVICIENISVYDFLVIEKKFIEFLADNFASLDCKNIFIVNIFVGNTSNPELEHCFSNAAAFSGQSIYTIYWGFSLDTGRIINNPQQPDDVAGLSRLLREAYTADGGLSAGVDENTSIRELNRRAVVESPFRKKTNLTILTYTIILINAAVLALMEMNGGSGSSDVLLAFGAISPKLVRSGEYYRMFTSMFLHIGLIHFLSNSLSLYIFGTRVEKYYGSVNFCVIYIASGMAGSLVSVIFTSYISAGASGAIFGIIGAAAAYSRRSGSSLDGLNLYLFIIFILTGITFGLALPNIDNFAHIGGLITGYLLGELIVFNISHRKDKIENNG